VALLARAIHGSQQTGGVLQIVLYLRGVGTTGLKLDTVIEGVTGIGVDDNIRSAYQFIAQNYLPGDEIYLFGFSRGAFTARSLAGLISACGILFRQSLGALPAAWAYYRSPKPHSPLAFATTYKAQCHLDPSITFLGVWDTVGSLGIPGSLLAASNKAKFAFHDTNPSPLVERAVQALAIDEHRRDFTPMVQQAEAVGLSFDWTCLADPKKLDVTAPAHDSSSGLFALDRYHPTLREIGMTKCAVKLNESLYVALDENGQPTRTINERMHRSVVARYAVPAQICSDDDNGTCSLGLYQPETLAPFFAGGTFAGLPVVT
jgi:type VI secretion system (T6SS) phospholipase Tle1-like effector